MTIRYVKNTGTNTAPYDTWAKAATTVDTAVAASSTGDIVYVSHQHVESTASAIAWSFGGAGDAVPIWVICVNDGAEPPTALATGASITSTAAAFSPTVASFGVVYVYGLTITVQGATARTIATAPSTACIFTWENCTFDNQSGSASGAQTISLGAVTSPLCVHINCSYKFTSAAASALTMNSPRSRVIGGSFLSGTASPNRIFTGENATAIGLDFSNLSSSVALFPSTTNGFNRLFDCKFPASWSGNLATSYSSAGRVEVTNTDDVATSYRARFGSYGGNGFSETTLVRSGGSMHGSVPFSWKMTSNAFGVGYPNNGFASIEIVKWNQYLGLITATIEILHDSATPLKDDEVWVEGYHLSSTGAPLAAYISDARAFMSAAANQSSSSATWTTTGMSNPNKQKLEVTFTAAMPGFVHLVVRLAKTSYTIYVDPMVTFSNSIETDTRQVQIPGGVFINATSPSVPTLLGAGVGG